MPGYDEELGRDSDTETFVALKAHIDNWRWKGVPFYLRTGKRLPERRDRDPHPVQPRAALDLRRRGARPRPTGCVIGIQPEENITLSLMAKVPGLDRDGIALARSAARHRACPTRSRARERRIAYERLLLDLIEGDQTLFVRRDEVEAQWDWIDAIRASWAEQGSTPKTYTRRHLGPERRDRADRARRRELA